MELSNTQTKKNIEKSFENETKALVRYFIYADFARKLGNDEVAELFDKMARNEIEHAKVWFQYMMEEPKSLLENLALSAIAENKEWKYIYPQCAETAREEGLHTAAMQFDRIASIECKHERLFFEAYAKLQGEESAEFLEAKAANDHQHEHVHKPNNTHKNSYFCLFCGYSSQDKEEVCPVCNAADAFGK